MARLAGQSDPSGGSNAAQFTTSAAAQFSSYQQRSTTVPWTNSAWVKGITAIGGIYGKLCAKQAPTTVNTDIPSTAWSRISATCATTGATSQIFCGYSVAAGEVFVAYGGQSEDGLYPGPYIPTTTIAVAAAADVLSVPDPTLIAPGGFYDVMMTVAPSYAQNEFGTDHDLLYFGANDRVYLQQSSGKIVMKTTGQSDVLSLALTWSREQSLTIRMMSRLTQRQIIVSGATTGNGATSGTAASAFTLPATAYLLGSNSGAEECANLLSVAVYRP